ncbi:MAG TPA: hypothetical protein VIX35_02170, partial [Vicinamibacterales bacterium]
MSWTVMLCWMTRPPRDWNCGTPQGVVRLVAARLRFVLAGPDPMSVARALTVPWQSSQPISIAAR